MISGNTLAGVQLDSAQSGNLIDGQLYRQPTPDRAPRKLLANDLGVNLEDNAYDNTVGGTASGAGNVISGNTSDGVEMFGLGRADGGLGTFGNLVAGNDIGTDWSGSFAIANGNDGVFITTYAFGNTIGGTAAGAANVISGNKHDGVEITGTGSSTNLVAGNLIGTNAAGTVAIANANAGVEIDQLATGNIIGGTTVGTSNLISGNQFGVFIAASDNLVEGNRIGTDLAGTIALANTVGVDVVDVFNSPVNTGNTIGGTSSGASNLISGNQTGVYVSASESLVEGNWIGTDVTGTLALPNNLGVGLDIGSGNTIGGTAPGAGNIISGNTGDGLEILGTLGTSGNVVAGNEIGTNAAGRAAIPNGGDGVQLNTGDSYSTIGGTIAAARNIISGNRGSGVEIDEAAFDVVEGNMIGVNAAGSSALANANYGVFIQGAIPETGGGGTSASSSSSTTPSTIATGNPGGGGSSNAPIKSNMIGGTVAGAGNVISGNGSGGIFITGGILDVVAGNWIGTDATGTIALANAGDGVELNQTSGNTIGGTVPQAANLISGNTNGVEINGSSENLVQGNMIGTDTTGTIVIGNSGAGVLVDGTSSDNTIGGPVGGARNLISGNAEGVMIEDGDPTGTLVAGNLIGTDIRGTSSVPNLTGGIIITGGSGTTIGGTVGLALNVISGNKGDGIDIESDAASTLVEGNYIGTDQTGTEPLPNSGDGMSVDDASGVTIGGTMQSAGNVISGNAQSGVSITGTTTTGILILGNRIGTDNTASLALGNSSFGVMVSGTPGVVIGGTAPGYRNIISANTTGGIGLYADTTGALVEGNYIGTDITALLPLGNGNGIQIDGGSSNNTIGGTTAGAGNTIAFSTGIGVDVDATAGTGNEIRLNSIFSNTGLGIDLGGDGFTLNNSAGHVGPNDYQNFPVITSVDSANGTTTVTGSLNSTPDTTFELDFYTLSSMNALGYGEGRYVLGSKPVTTDATGNFSFSFNFPTPAGGAKFVTATATDPNGNTSEFSQAYGVDTPPTAVIGFTSITVDAGASIPFDGLGSTSPSGLPLTYSWSFGDGATASGPEPMHAYAAPGPETVTLTVNDGFGGVNIATATVNVDDVAPVFTPNNFTPPLAYTTPAPGDGFGESVASNYGNVAIGAPLENGTGAVYLYDGVSTDDGVSSTYVYGALIHTFADPNPAAGDEFGASLAVVGNELVVGAPGSSISGPGDGVAYVFDANVESTTFGQLLATLLIPNADPMNDAHFGAAVGTTDTNIVIGAPGRDGGTGEAYEFEGDTTQANFGDLLVKFINPDGLASSGFGAAVAGIGNNVIVGAPSDSTAGAGTGTVYLFDGTSGAESLAILNPHPADSTGFGSAVASVGSNILVGSPDDNTAGPGAGAAFLFLPTGLLRTTFVQPDGGGGGFGTSVAGTQNTALIGAPGAHLATSDAGAAYLFDADPASPTFSRAIGAVQEATPTTGDAFGTAVGFDTGALIVGAAGAIGSGITGAEAVDLYQQGATLTVSSGLTYATPAPYDSVILSGTYLDANTSATLKATINWGDGSAPTTVMLPPGSYAFSAPHEYLVDPPAGYYSIGVTLTDQGGETTVAQTTVTVSSPAPAFASPGLVLSSSSIVEGGTVTLSGTITSPGGGDGNTVAINWGDGTGPTTISLAPGMDKFSTTHPYPGNPAGVASENYTINASVTDQTTEKAGYTSATITVNKVAPQFAAGDLSLSETTANEGDTITLSGQFTDPDAVSSYTTTINWGDGSTPATLNESLGQIVASLSTPGLYTYSATHQYLDNPPGELTGGNYPINVSVSDGVNTASAATSIIVNNVPPTVTIVSDVDLTNGTITTTANVTDPGFLQIESVAWTLTQNGIVIGTDDITGTAYTFTIPDPLGVLVASATVTDSDGGTGFGSAQMVIIYQTGASVVINSTAITVSMGNTPVATTSLSGSGAVVALVTGSNVTVNATAATNSVELIGYGSGETLLGGAGNDLLIAGPGANSVVGGGGNDTIVSNQGDDTLVGGGGNDIFRINPGQDPLVVAPGGFNTLDFSIATVPVSIDLGMDSGQQQIVNSDNDEVTLIGQFNTLIGSPYGGSITANNANDLLYLTTGNSTITGGSGHDSIVGGSGNDIIYLTTGNSTITGGSGTDSIRGGTGNDFIYLTTGNSTITGGSGTDSIRGGTGNDFIYLTTGNSTITGGSGHDSITGGTGNDIIYLTTGNSTITGGSGTDSIRGGTGNDIIYLTTGNSTITGGSGTDSIVGGTGNDLIYLTTGNSTITGGSGTDSIVGGTGNDFIYLTTGNSTITGGSGHDSITGGTGNDIIYLTTGNSTITGGSGTDSIVGGTGNDFIYLTTGNATVTGGSGHDSITGGTGNDIIYLTTGNSTISGGPGNETILGGQGNDIVFGNDATAIIVGGSGDNTITGGQGNDIIVGGSGNDSITGGSGDDLIVGGFGNDTITGGSGDDTITGGSGNDIIYGGTGDDLIVGGTGNDSIAGGSGSSTITGGSGNDIIWGGTLSTTVGSGGAPTIVFTGTTGNDSITGGSGDDTIYGGNGTDIIYGGVGDDTIVGGQGADSILGGSGDDIIYGGSLSSTLSGGSGDDSIFGGNGNDIIYGGAGDSTIVGGTGNDSITGGPGDDVIYGGPGDNTISGGGGNVTIVGGVGYDTNLGGGTSDSVFSSNGNDVLEGGGFDSWLMDFGSQNLTVNDSTLTTSGGGLPSSVSTLSGFQNVLLAAGTGNFTLDASGFSGGAYLQGGTGNDTLIGARGPDTLVGGTGNDSLLGGGANDTFAFNSYSSGNQTIDEPQDGGVAGLDFSQAPAGISINLGESGPQAVMPATLGDGALNLTLADPTAIDNVLGSSYDDTIIGNANDNTLLGGGGQDLIAGLGGDDVIEGAVTRTIYLDFDTYELPGQHFYTDDEREAIQKQITTDFSAFSYVFTQIQPQSGPYTTIYFNDPTLVGLEGGIATEIDWRDLDISGTTSLTAAGLAVVPPDSGGVNVNNFLGGPGQPAASSDDFIGLSATIAAHELGHLSGLEHADAFGPIGSGIYSGVKPGLYNPGYPGAIDASETIWHVMASGASVNSTLEDAIDDPFFGERESIALAFGASGSPTNEQIAPHESTGDAQPIVLAPLVVPDTDLEGADADKSFDVTAADVAGYLGETNGASNTDFYSFTAPAGTLINFQLMSAVLTRTQAPEGTTPDGYNQGAFDTYLAIYNSSGQVIEYNDDSFQDTDSSIIDLTLPYTGTYYAIVTSSPNSVSLHEPLTGDYELFMYTFATNGDPPAGDTLDGGSGTDTIIGGSADDMIAAKPQDTIVYGSGTTTVLGAAPYLNVTAGADETVNEGQYVTLTGSFIDPFENPTHNYDWQVLATSGQMIADGHGPSFTFSPGNAGTYTVTYTASDPNGGQGTATVVITSLAVAPVITPPASTETALAGVDNSIGLGMLTVQGVGPWTDTIKWGDGQCSTYNPAGSGPLSLAHTYAAPGTYTICETVSEYDGDSTTATFSIKVIQATTTTTLSSSAPSAVYGQTVTFTATVGGPGVATGSVAFYSGPVDLADQIGTGTLSVVGGLDVATFSTHSLAVSSKPYAITAVYGGDAADVGRPSNVLSETIGQDGTTTQAGSSASSLNFGQAIKLSASVAPKAPGAGSPTGSVDFYDTTTQTDLGSVKLSAGSASMTISTLPVGSQTITETYSGDGDFTTSNSSVSETVVLSIYALNASAISPTITGPVYLSGSSSINIPGQLIVDSPAKPAVTLTGTSRIIASSGVEVAGTVSVASTASIGPKLTTGITPVADPLAGFAVPSLTGSATSINLTSGSAIIFPGIYSSIKVSGTKSTLVLEPGVYVITGGGLSVTGSANITGSGVMIYNAGSSYPASGGTYGGITLSTTGGVNLSAPTTGAYAGYLFFQSSTNPTAISITESSTMNLTGVIYASDALLSASGTSAGVLNDAMVVNRVQFSGSATAGAPAGMGVQSVSVDVAAPLSSSAAVRPAAPAAFGTSSPPDAVLDELVAALLSSSNGDVFRSGANRSSPSNKVAIARAGQVGVRSATSGETSIPAGPLARLERPRQTSKNVTGLTDSLAIVARTTSDRA